MKTLISNLVHTTRFWNNLHQLCSYSNDWSAKLSINLWKQVNQKV